LFSLHVDACISDTGTAEVDVQQTPLREVRVNPIASAVLCIVLASCYVSILIAGVLRVVAGLLPSRMKMALALSRDS
jgi:hypothetical protein